MPSNLLLDNFKYFNLFYYNNTSMKLRQLFLLCVIAAFAISCGGGAKEGEGDNKDGDMKAAANASYMLDTEGSKVNWTGSMLGLYDHTGNLKFSEGSVTVKDGVVTEGSFIIDMKSMSATDTNYNEEKPSNKSQ